MKIKMLQVCIVCLAMDTKFHEIMEGSQLYECYRLISSITQTDLRLPNTVCWECIHLLKKCFKFRLKCQRSHQILMDILQYNNHQLSKAHITAIDRNAENLISNLSMKLLNDNYYDVHINEDMNENVTEKTELVLCNELENDKNDSNNVTLPIQEVEVDDFLTYDSSSSRSSDVVLADMKRKRKREKKTKSNKKIDRRKKPAQEVINENLFTITDLNLQQQKAAIGLRRESLNFKNSPFKCLQCFKGFLDEDAYNSHIVRHTDQSGVYECEVCKIHFKQSRALQNHARSHRQQFSCKGCQYVTTRRHAVKLHEEWHNGTKYQCPHCRDDFVNFSTYMGHIRIKHPSDFVCQLCGYSFVSQKGVGLHKKLKHRFQDETIPDIGPECDLCHLKFASEEAFATHIKVSAKHGKTIEPKNSKIRRKNPVSKPKENTKKQKKTKPKGPISCEQCDQQLPDSLSYYRHFRRVHPDKNRTNYPSMKTKCMCEVCGKMFQSAALLQDHSWSHSVGATFPCTECGKSFQRRYRLVAHARLHRPPLHAPAHKCTTCGKLFSTASNRKRHMFSHTGLKPFQCEMCGKAFKHASEKRAHITYVHLKKPWPKRSRNKKTNSQASQEAIHSANEIANNISTQVWTEQKTVPEKTMFYD